MSEILCVSTFDIICISNFNIKCVHCTMEIPMAAFKVSTILATNALAFAYVDVSRSSFALSFSIWRM